MYPFGLLSIFTCSWTLIATYELPEMPDVLTKFNQGDYKLKFERFDVVQYDRTVYKLMEMKTFKYNRTTPVVNATIILHENTEAKYLAQMLVLIQVYKFLSNEYRHFPIRFQVNYCKAVAANAIGMQNLNTCGNISICPMLTGVPYSVCNFAPEETKLPPLIPSGSYMVEVTLLYKNRPAAIGQGYGTVWRPVV